MPEHLDPEQIQDYLGKLAGSIASRLRSIFKHTVYGLRFYFKLIGLPQRPVELPSIRAKHKLHGEIYKSFIKKIFGMQAEIGMRNKKIKIHLSNKTLLLIYEYITFSRINYL